MENHACTKFLKSLERNCVGTRKSEKLYTRKDKSCRRVRLRNYVQIFVLPPAVSVRDEASGDGPDEHPCEDGAADEALLRS